MRLNQAVPRLLATCVLSAIVALTFARWTPVKAAEACEPQNVATKYPGLAGKTIKIGISAADKPFSYRDPGDPNKIIGFDADYATNTFKCIGLPFEFKVGGWSGLLPSLTSGQTDVMWDGLYYTPERAKSVDYVLYSAAASAIVVPKGNPKRVHDMMGLCGLNAVSQIGSVEVASLQRASDECVKAGKPEIHITVAQDRPSSLRELQVGRADAYLGSQALDYGPDLEFAYVYNSGIKIGVGVGKGNTELEKALYDAIRVLQANGTAGKLYATYDIAPILSTPAEIVRQ